MSAKEPALMVIEDPGVNRLMRKLHPGQKIKGRIVLELGHNRYVLRIYGYNLVMASRLSFKRFQEVWVEVVRNRPKLNLRLISKRTTNTQGAFNITV